MEQFIVVLGVAWLAVISPGADFAMVSRLSFIEGRRAGLYAALGIAIACWFHIGYAIFGLAVVERVFPRMLDALRIAGAVYLAYLGLTLVLKRSLSPNVQMARAAPSGRKALWSGVLTNALNPKASIFMVSIYTQAIGRDTSLATKLAYGLAISLSHLLWFAAVAAFLSRPSIRDRVLTHERFVNAVIGALLILLGGMLAFGNVAPGAKT